MRLSFRSVLIIKAGNQKGLRALLKLILRLKTTILMIPSSMTMMHLTTLSVGALVDTNLHKSGRATRTTVLCHSLPPGVKALALRNRIGTLCALNEKLLQSSRCAGVLGCGDWSSGQEMCMVNHGHLAKSSEIWKTCIYRRDRSVSKRTYSLRTLRLAQVLRLLTRPELAVY
jgi:hypothetical protein